MQLTPYEECFIRVFGSRWFDQFDIIIMTNEDDEDREDDEDDDEDGDDGEGSAFKNFMAADVKERFHVIRTGRTHNHGPAVLLFRFGRVSLITTETIGRSNSLFKFEDTRTKRSFWVFPVYLSTGRSISMQQIKNTIYNIDKQQQPLNSTTTLIVAGNFNEPLNYKREGRGAVVEAIRELSLSRVFYKSMDGKLMEHALVSGDINVVNREVSLECQQHAGTIPHFPLRFEFNIKNTRGQNFRRILQTVREYARKFAHIQDNLKKGTHERSFVGIIESDELHLKEREIETTNNGCEIAPHAHMPLHGDNDTLYINVHTHPDHCSSSAYDPDKNTKSIPVYNTALPTGVDMMSHLQANNMEPYADIIVSSTAVCVYICGMYILQEMQYRDYRKIMEVCANNSMWLATRNLTPEQIEREFAYITSKDDNEKISDARCEIHLAYILRGEPEYT